MKLSALSFENTPRNLSESRVAGFRVFVSSIKANVTATCLPINEDGTDKEIFDLRGVMIVLVIMFCVL